METRQIQPWHVGERGNGAGFPIMSPYNDGMPGEVELARFSYRPHALCAAAAPEMLAALKWAVPFLQGLMREGGTLLTAKGRAALDDAQAAIVKAESGE